MKNIMELARGRGDVFKYGSGTGTDLSTLRSRRERRPRRSSQRSDVVPQGLRCHRQRGEVGGKTRRAAKMNTLKVWHPDIKDFIEAKPDEERKPGQSLSWRCGAINHR